MFRILHIRSSQFWLITHKFWLITFSVSQKVLKFHSVYQHVYKSWLITPLGVILYPSGAPLTMFKGGGQS